MAALLAGCGDDEFWGPRQAIESVEIAVSPNPIPVGGRAQAVGVARWRGRAIAPRSARVSFSSGDPSVATIHPVTGAVTGIAPGRAALFAHAAGVQGADTVEVVALQ